MFEYKIKTHDGRYLASKGHNIDEALSALGLSRSDVKRSMPTKWLDKPPMPEEVKAKLKAINEERRALRRKS